MIWKWLKYQVLPPARIGQAARWARASKVGVYHMFLPRTSRSGNSGSDNSSKGVRKKKEKEGSQLESENSLYSGSRDRRQGLTFPRKTLRSLRLAWAWRQDNQSYWSSWDKMCGLCTGTGSPVLLSVPCPIQAMPRDLGPDLCQ